MPILVTGNKSVHVSGSGWARHTQKGLTFIEVMVVVLILGLMASVVLLNLPDETDPSKEDAFRFAVRLQAAQDIAIMRGQFVGLEVAEGRYRFLAYENGEWTETRLPGDRPAEGAVSEDVLVRLETGETVEAGTAGGDRGFITIDDASDEEKPVIPQARFEPTGEVDPFELVFIGKQQVWQVSLDQQAVIRVSLASD